MFDLLLWGDTQFEENFPRCEFAIKLSLEDVPVERDVGEVFSRKSEVCSNECNIERRIQNIQFNVGMIDNAGCNLRDTFTGVFVWLQKKCVIITSLNPFHSNYIFSLSFLYTCIFMQSPKHHS